MKRRLKEITPNIHNGQIFVDSLSEESIGTLAKDIEKNGLHYPIRITAVGAVIIDGERRWRACKKLGWDIIEVLTEDVHRNDILDCVIEAAASQRQMTLIEQARVYSTYYNHLKRAHKKGDLNHIAAKKLAIQKAQLPFRSITLADQLVQIADRADPDVHEKLVRGEMSITGAYERILRRFYKPEPVIPLPKPPLTAAELEKMAAQNEARKVTKDELKFAKRYVAAHAEELRESEESQRKMLALYEPEPPPAAKKFKDNEETARIIEAFESLSVKEPPEQLVGRLASLIEAIIGSVKEVDEQRARDIVRNVLKPMALRLGYELPRHEFEVPAGPQG